MRKSAIIVVIAAAIVATTASGKVKRRTLGIFQNNVPETETIAPENMGSSMTIHGVTTLQENSPTISPPTACCSR